MIFQLYMSCCDDYHFWLLEHPDKTEAEFDADCVKALREVGEGYINSVNTSYVETIGWIAAALPKLKEYGYKVIQPHSWGFEGGYVIGWDSLRIDGGEDGDKKWARIVGKDLYEKALAKNEQIRNDV